MPVNLVPLKHPLNFEAEQKCPPDFDWLDSGLAGHPAVSHPVPNFEKAERIIHVDAA